jgi:PAS domain-containing protein
MNELQQATPDVKKNIFLIRTLMALILLCFVFLYYQAYPSDMTPVIVYTAFLVLSFVPFFFFEEEKFRKIRFQYIIFLMDSVFLIGAISLFDHFETNLLIIIFLTFFISAMSQSVGRALVVAFAVIGLYLYMVLKTANPNFLDPVLFLSCALLLVVSIHSGYLAYRTVQEDKEVMDLARRANLLTEKLREGDQMAMEYASSLKNVLDTMPIGAIAVSKDTSIIFVNARVGKILEINPKTLLPLRLNNIADNRLGKIGERMALALQDRRELKREYIDTEWMHLEKRFRLDSATGMGPDGNQWGYLFLLQEAVRTSEGDQPQA